MAGHSKWANIKHRKAAQDAKRGKIFTKLIRELVVAAKQGGPSPEDNPRLRAAVDKALGANMTRDTIDRAIARGAGTNDADDMEELTYEGYATGGIAVLVEVMTTTATAPWRRCGTLSPSAAVISVLTVLSPICSPGWGRSPLPPVRMKNRSWKWRWKQGPKTLNPMMMAPWM